MSALWIALAFVAGLAVGVVLMARLVRAFTDEIQGLFADLFDRVRYQAREMERDEDA